MQRSPAYPFLLAAVILLGVLIVIALGVLVVGLSTRLGSSHRDTAPTQFTLAAGARVISADVSGDRLVLRLKGSFGDEIDIIDLETGRLVAKVRSAPPATQ